MTRCPLHLYEFESSPPHLNFQTGARPNILTGSGRQTPTTAAAPPRARRTTSSTSTPAPKNPSLNFPPKNAIRRTRRSSTSAGTSRRRVPLHLRRIGPKSAPTATTNPRRQRHPGRTKRPSDKVKILISKGPSIVEQEDPGSIPALT